MVYFIIPSTVPGFDRRSSIRSPGDGEGFEMSTAPEMIVDVQANVVPVTSGTRVMPAVDPEQIALVVVELVR